MKSLLLLLGFLFAGPLFADTSNPLSVFIPEHARALHPKCSCDCDHKIIFKGGPVTQQSLETWSKEAAITAYTYGFGNYEPALKKASQYFTPVGWDGFRAALNQSGNLALVIENKLLVSAIPAGEPTISKTANSHWTIQMPLVVKYENANSSIRKNFQLTMTVVQSEPQAGIQGLGIEQFIAAPTKTG